MKSYNFIRLNGDFDETEMKTYAMKLIQEYSFSKDSSQPKTVHCVSAIRKILESGHEGPAKYFCQNDFLHVGSIPKKLLEKYKASIIKTASPETGDLFFTGRAALISHVAIIIADQVFQATHREGGQITLMKQDIFFEDFLIQHNYRINLTHRTLSTYNDKRDSNKC